MALNAFSTIDRPSLLGRCDPMSLLVRSLRPPPTFLLFHLLRVCLASIFLPVIGNRGSGCCAPACFASFILLRSFGRGALLDSPVGPFSLFSLTIHFQSLGRSLFRRISRKLRGCSQTVRSNWITLHMLGRVLGKGEIHSLFFYSTLSVLGAVRVHGVPALVWSILSLIRPCLS